MYWKQFRPFVLELGIFLIILILTIPVIITNSITIRWSTLTALFLIFIVLWALQYGFNFVMRSVFALFDCITRDYVTVTAEFVQQFVFRSSSFLDKNGPYQRNHGIGVVETEFYKIAVRSENGIDMLIASEFHELLSGEKYKITFGRKSKIVIDIVREK